MKHRLILLLTAAALLATACTKDIWNIDLVMANKRFVSYDVEFNARAGGNAGPLQVFSGNKNCAVPPGKSRQGCVAFAENTFGNIKFTLRTDSGTNKNECGDSGVQWVITKVEATVTVDPANDNKGKNGTFGSDLTGTWVTKAFYPIEDASAGLLYEADLDEGTTSVVFQNRNDNTEPEVLWYRVTASKCGSDNPGPIISKVSDPRIENKGLD